MPVLQICLFQPVLETSPGPGLAIAKLKSDPGNALAGLPGGSRGSFQQCAAYAYAIALSELVS